METEQILEMEKQRLSTDGSELDHKIEAKPVTNNIQSKAELMARAKDEAANKAKAEAELKFKAEEQKKQALLVQKQK